MDPHLPSSQQDQLYDFNNMPNQQDHQLYDFNNMPNQQDHRLYDFNNMPNQQDHQLYDFNNMPSEQDQLHDSNNMQQNQQNQLYCPNNMQTHNGDVRYKLTPPMPLGNHGTALIRRVDNQFPPPVYPGPSNAAYGHPTLVLPHPRERPAHQTFLPSIPIELPRHPKKLNIPQDQPIRPDEYPTEVQSRFAEQESYRSCNMSLYRHDFVRRGVPWLTPSPPSTPEPPPPSPLPVCGLMNALSRLSLRNEQNRYGDHPVDSPNNSDYSDCSENDDSQ